MTTQQLQLPISISALQELLRKYGVERASVFGSYARGEATPESDIDFLVTLEPGRSLWDLGGLQYELEEITKKRVDVTTRLNPHFAPYIEPDLVTIL